MFPCRGGVPHAAAKRLFANPAVRVVQCVAHPALSVSLGRFFPGSNGVAGGGNGARSSHHESGRRSSRRAGNGGTLEESSYGADRAATDEALVRMHTAGYGESFVLPVAVTCGDGLGDVEEKDGGYGGVMADVPRQTAEGEPTRVWCFCGGVVDVYLTSNKRPVGARVGPLIGLQARQRALWSGCWVCGVSCCIRSLNRPQQ